MIQKLLGLPINASAEGGAIDALNGWVHLLMLVLFVGWGLFFTYILFRFRRGNHPRADHEGVKTHTSSYLEVGIAVIEIILLVALSIPFWAKKVHAALTDGSALHVRVIAQQFAWNIQYPGPDGKFGRTDMTKINDAEQNFIGLDRTDKDAKDDVMTLNQLHLPVGKPVVLEVTTKDVIHSFFLPLFRVKQDTIPGMRIPVHFTPMLTSAQAREQMTETIRLPAKRNLDLYVPLEDLKDKAGNVIAQKGRSLSAATGEKLFQNGITSITVAPATPFEIACAQLCGLNHFKMKGYLTVETEEQFKKWYADAVEDAKSE